MRYPSLGPRIGRLSDRSTVHFSGGLGLSLHRQQNFGKRFRGSKGGAASRNLPGAEMVPDRGTPRAEPK